MPGLEILFVLDGRLKIDKGRGSTFSLGSADILTLARLERLNIEPLAENVVFSLRVGADLLASAFNGAIPHFDCDSHLAPDRDFSRIREILAEIACNDTIEIPANLDNRLLFRSRLFRLFDELAHNFLAAEDVEERDSGEIGKRVQAIKSYLSENFRAAITLGDLAESLQLTPQYLSKFLKQQLGTTFHEYLRGKRLESALLDLILTDDTVTSIAYDNGFPTLTSFYEAAKEATGLSPADYRKRHRLSDQQEVNTGQERELGYESVRELFSGYESQQAGEALKAEASIRKAEADAKVFSELRRPWSEILNTGFASDFAKADFQRQITFLQAELKFKYARFQGIFSKEIIDDQAPNFSQIDKLIDFLLAIDLKPFIELGNKPEKININYQNYLFFNPEGATSLSVELFELFLRHAVNRYGLDEVNAWRFEYWAEHDEEPTYKAEKIEDYVRTFASIQNVLKKIAPRASLGGPGFLTFAKLEVLGTILQSLAAQKASFDFVSFYLYSYAPLASDDANVNSVAILWNKTQMTQTIRKVIDYCHASGISNKQFYVTEWNFDYSCRNLFHDTCFKAPFIIQNSIDAIDSVHSFSYWLASDISSEYSDSDSLLYGGSGLISRHGIRKPAYYAFLFLSRLGSRLLAKGNGYIITAKSDAEIVAIIFNYKYLSELSRIRNEYRDIGYDFESHLEDHNEVSFSLKISHIHPGRYKVRQNILTAKKGSILDEWRKLNGGGTVDRSELAYLDRVSVPAVSVETMPCEDALELSYRLEPNETRLIEITLEQ